MNLETASNPQDLKRVVIEPVSRVEGHGKVTLLLDDNNKVHQARLHIVEFRGFEKFIQGRPFWEIPTLVQRLCGICPVSHLLAASKACDFFVGGSDISPTAENLRRLLHAGQVLQSHALHFFHLSSPDLLFGFEDEVAHRNIVGVIQDHPEIALWGVKLRKFGQEVIRVVTGKRIHGTGSVPGGMNKGITNVDRDYLLAEIRDVIEWAQEAVKLSKKCFYANPDYHTSFGYFESNFLSLNAPDGAMDLYHGGLRAKDADGKIIFDNVDYTRYMDVIKEETKPWTYMKFPHLIQLGAEKGSYRVGPLARINNCDFIRTPRAEEARQEFMATTNGRPAHASLAYHWTRMIEVLYCAEEIEQLLNDQVSYTNDLMRTGTPQREGVGVIEAPRGTLFHHYIIDENDVIEKANLIVSTTSNNQAMNEAVRAVANQYFDGREVTEGLLNHLEVAIRAYDPCLSCATHALGKMPLEVELVNPDGEVISRLEKGSE